LTGAALETRHLIFAIQAELSRRLNGYQLCFWRFVMKKFALAIAALAIAAPTMGAGAAFAQTTASDAPSSTTAKVENWTTEQWDAAKTEWAKDKTKWANCQQQSTDQKLADRKSWSFLYSCMTKSS
jgi:hypothetical protein